jgi:hypothetical protein
MPEHFTALPDAGLRLPGHLAEDVERLNEDRQATGYQAMNIKMFVGMS